MLALCRELLRSRLPDVYTGLLDAGVVEVDLASQMPPTLADRAAQPGDERLSVLMTRRPTDPPHLRRVRCLLLHQALPPAEPDRSSRPSDNSGRRGVRRVRFVLEGQPVVTGLHAIGDTVCTTHPTLGRGLSLAVQGALDLADSLAAHPDDPPAQAEAINRAFRTIMGMLRPPEEVYRDRKLVTRVQDILAAHGVQPINQPGRKQLLAALDGATI
ncbi:MAG: hypothetical protein ACRDRW_02615 [Pseudonocardiaceae bacterium]